MKYRDHIFKNTLSNLFILVLGAFVFFGCGTETELEPAPAANTVPGNPYAAVDEVHNVKIKAESDAWVGREEIKNEITPIKITVENNGDVPLRFQVSDFSLVSPTTNNHYAGLPLHQIEGEVEEPVLVEGYMPVANPAFHISGFRVAPYLTDVYAGIQPYTTSMYYYDPYYYRTYYEYWKTLEIDLPTRVMLEQGLPDGVIEPGGKIEGFVYFENVPVKEEVVTLTTQLINAEDGDILGTVNIPFEVEKNELTETSN